MTNNTDFRHPVISATVPQIGAQTMVTIGRMAISVPMAEGDNPICCMYNVMNGLITPVEMRKVKYSSRILFLCDSMVQNAEGEAEGDSAAIVFKGGSFGFVAVAGLILSLFSGRTSTDDESHIVDKPADAEVDVGVKLSAARGVVASPLGRTTDDGAIYRQQAMR